jgi:transketolase
MTAPAAAGGEIVRDAPFAAALLELGRAREDVVVLSADLSRYTDVLPFAEAFPDRFFQVGMAEQNMMGVAGGLAKSNLLPIAVTYGVFATRRAYDQVAMALCTGPSRGILVAFLPGITTPFRATHQATDDLALMRCLPRMAVIDPADSTELGAALRAAVDYDGPAYVRGLRGRVAQLFAPEGFALRLGEPRVLRDGDDVGLIGSGLGTPWALEAAALLARRGTTASVLHVPTLKPIDSAAIVRFCSRLDTVVTVENHSIVGGLGSVVCEALGEAGCGTRVRRLGVADRWAAAGSLEHVRRDAGLDVAAIAEAAGSA